MAAGNTVTHERGAGGTVTTCLMLYTPAHGCTSLKKNASATQRVYLQACGRQRQQRQLHYTHCKSQSMDAPQLEASAREGE